MYCYNVFQLFLMYLTNSEYLKNNYFEIHVGDPE
jgi:hypothetical protein